MLVMFAISIGVLLSFSALAIDIGQQTIWKHRVDKAARAGALAGLGYRALVGWTESQANIATLKQVASDTTIENLRAYSVAGTNQSVSVTYDTTNDSIEVLATQSIPSFLAGRIRGVLGFSIGDTNSTGTTYITGSGKAQFNPAFILLLLDISGSMLCGKDSLGSDENCESRLTNAAFNFDNTKLKVMMDSLSTFTKFFNPNTDYVTVIPFNLAAKTTFSMNDPSAPAANKLKPFGPLNSARHTTFLNAIGNDLKNAAKSNTNICDSLINAIEDLNSLALSPRFAGTNGLRIKPQIVLFSDGAPNAMRGIFKDITGAPERYQYSLEWYDGTNIYRSPGPVCLKSPNYFSHVIQEGQVSPNDTALQCAPVISDPKVFQTALDRNATPYATSRAVLTSLDFYIPGTNNTASVTGVPFSDLSTTWRDPNWPPSLLPANTSTAINIQNADQLPYYCSIEAADYLRKIFGATIYTIGLGPEAPPCSDPLQDADNNFARKDYFLGRLAMDPVSISGGGAGASWATTYNFQGGRRDVNVSGSTPGYECKNATITHRFRKAGSTSASAPTSIKVGYTSSTTPNSLKPTDPDTSATIDTEGKYFPTEKADDLPALFTIIAKNILLRRLED